MTAIYSKAITKAITTQPKVSGNTSLQPQVSPASPLSGGSTGGGGFTRGGGHGRANPNNVQIAQGHQDKHIPGTNNYKQSVASGANRSILTVDAQSLLDEFAGTGYKIPGAENKERVNFGKVIGQYFDDTAGKFVDTTNGIIHYNQKGGAHIVPAAPAEFFY